jgi:hypothetical protein
MKTPDYRALFETARQIGEAHSQQMIQHANDAVLLRRVIWRALCQLRAGKPAQARRTLEAQIKKDQ